jgi:cytidylate kinase
VAGVVVAIDGPAASGKSSVARRVAKQLGFVYVNTGEMYRAMAWLALRRGIDPSDAGAVADLASRARVECPVRDGVSAIEIDGEKPEAHLREEAVNRAVSLVARVPEVRRSLVALQRALALERSLVMEGRDIGSAVFPETPYKFYIDASPEVRARRRAAEGYRDEIGARDRVDSSRAESPLTVAGDACVIDTSDLGIEAVVALVLERLAERGLAEAPRSAAP